MPHRLLIRGIKVCSEEEDLEQKAKNIIQKLQEKRKYPNELLQKAYHKVQNIEKIILLK